MDEAMIALLEKVGHIGVIPSMVLGALVAWKIAGMLKAIDRKIDKMHLQNVERIASIDRKVARVEGILKISH